MFIKVIKETHYIGEDALRPETLNLINIGNKADFIFVNGHGISGILLGEIGNGIFFTLLALNEVFSPSSLQPSS